jgi:hypothetical protein
MAHDNDICDKCDIYRKCDTHDMCHTVTQCDTLKQKRKTFQKSKNMAIEEINIDIVKIIQCDNMIPL